MLTAHPRCLQMTGAKAVAAYELRRIPGDPVQVPATRLVPASEPFLFPESERVVSAQPVYAVTNLARGRPVRTPEAIIDTFFLPATGTVDAILDECAQRVAS